MREIADACGIKASSIYAHLRSKEQLLSDLALMAHEEHRDGLNGALLGSGSEPADQLRALVRAHARFHAEYPVLATVANNELHALSEESGSAIQTIRDDLVRLFTDVIERGVKLGQFHCDDPVLVTAAIAAMGIRLAAWYRSEGQDGTDGYATRVWQLFGALGRSYTIDEIADRYAEFALKLVA
jgi:AcrR family transcriptional regulator